MKKIEQYLWSAYDNYRLGSIEAANLFTTRAVENLLKNDKTITDNYLEKLAINVFTNIVLNNFYNKNGVSLIDIYAIVYSKQETIKNIDEFNKNFKDINNIDIFKNITEEMLNTARMILKSNIRNVLLENLEVYFIYENSSLTAHNKEIIEFFDNEAIIIKNSKDNLELKVAKNLDKVKDYILNNENEINQISLKKQDNYMKSSSRNDLNIKINGKEYYLSRNIAEMEEFYNNFMDNILKLM